MWIFCKYGFFSAVQHKDKTDKLLIRARFEGDLERLAGGLPEDERKLCSSITETPHADYRFRMEIPKCVFAKIMERISSEIDYANFKDSVHEGNGSRRDFAYMRCWAELRHWQDCQAEADR